MSSDAEGEEAIKAQTAVHSPKGDAVGTADDDELVHGSAVAGKVPRHGMQSCVVQKPEH